MSQMHTPANPVRKWKRTKIDIRVRLRRWEEPDEAASVVRTFELSEGGMSVYASESIEVGAYLIAEVLVPGAPGMLNLRAIVRNRKGFRCGMQFVDIEEPQAAVLKNYLATLSGMVEI